MDSTQLLITLLTTLGYRLPMLIALGVALVMLWDTPRGRIRRAALGGISVMLAATLLGGLLSVLPLLMIANGNFSGFGQMNAVLSVLHMGVSLAQALGIVLLVWALGKALHGTAATPPA